MEGLLVISLVDREWVLDGYISILIQTHDFE